MTRQWDLPPEVMCDQHLLGEHKEMHQELGLINADHVEAVAGHVENGQFDLSTARDRHEELVEEMLRRDMNHNSPFPEETDWMIKTMSVYKELGAEVSEGIDPLKNIVDLLERCEDCRERILEHYDLEEK